MPNAMSKPRCSAGRSGRPRALDRVAQEPLRCARARTAERAEPCECSVPGRERGEPIALRSAPHSLTTCARVHKDGRHALRRTVIQGPTAQDDDVWWRETSPPPPPHTSPFPVL
eukprot:6211067-Pleurochrysis_carterae.AAC.3